MTPPMMASKIKIAMAGRRRPRTSFAGGLAVADGAGAVAVAAAMAPELGWTYAADDAALVVPEEATAAGTLPELESRNRRRRSAPISAAVWHRMSRSFSSAF